METTNVIDAQFTFHLLFLHKNKFPLQNDELLEQGGLKGLIEFHPCHVSQPLDFVLKFIEKH